jgi:succinylglutamate desuccinylase
MRGEASGRFRRLVGRVEGEAAGPTLLVVGGIHGNEPAGVHAAERVLARLRARALPRRGAVVALAGNVSALEAGVRHRAKDLNRAWTPERLAALSTGGDGARDAEDVEQEGLLGAIDDAIAGARGRVHLLDLHTTSGEGAPFAAAGGSRRSREFAAAFPLTVLRRLTGRLAGTLVEALSARGVAAMVVENGQNADPRAVAHAEAALWVALVASGVLDEADAPEVVPARRLLARARGALPRTIDVFYRHAISPGDRFVMRPGYRHFQRVRRGEVLGRDARGDVAARAAGFVLLPLYQALGDEGFFLGRTVSPRPARPRARA